jgi:hypothetical protein
MTLRRANRKQQKYADQAAYYAGRAIICTDAKLWPEAATNYGSSLESLLRIRFGEGPKLVALVQKFDSDSLFDGISMHEGETQRCPTCLADNLRKLRNAVHPDCWRDATEQDVKRAQGIVLAIYHALVSCGGTRIADFKTPPQSVLVELDSQGVLHSSECPAGNDAGTDKK